MKIGLLEVKTISEVEFVFCGFEVGMLEVGALGFGTLYAGNLSSTCVRSFSFPYFFFFFFSFFSFIQQQDRNISNIVSMIQRSLVSYLYLDHCSVSEQQYIVETHCIVL